jgi:hypothetical protein
MWRDKTLLVVKIGEPFADRCVKTNRPAHGRRLQQVAERGSAITLLFHLWSPIAGFLIGSSLTRSIAFAVGLGDEAYRRRNRALWTAAAITAVSLAVAGYGVTLIGQGGLDIWVLPLAVLATLGGLAYGLNASTLLTAKRITDEYVWLRGVHPDFLAELPEWPGEAGADLRRMPETNDGP